MYLNNAGASITSSETYRIIVDYLELEKNIGAYGAAALKENEISEFYNQCAISINAIDSRDIAFIDSASRGWNLIIRGLDLLEGDKILTLSSEFGTNLITLYKKVKESKAKLIVMECPIDGSVDLEELENYLKKGVKIIAISHAAAHASIINPVYEIGELALKYNCTYIIDGCQSIGNIPVDVQKMKCDAFVATGRKWLRGPRGTGFLYVNKNSNFSETHIDLASADLILDRNNKIKNLIICNGAKRFELWERNIAMLLGLGNAVKEFNQINQTSIFKNKQNFANFIRNNIVLNKKFQLMGKKNSETGICGFYLNSPELEDDFIARSKNIGLVFSSMRNWDCPLHFPKNGANAIFRLSPHYYTEHKDINNVIEFLTSY